MDFALIKNNVVINIIVADQNFIDLISNQYDACVRVDNLEVRPSINWIYENGQFQDPNVE
jgi:hypothetical protein